MKRTPMPARKAPMARSRVKPKRSTPRRREAPRWDWDAWLTAGPMLEARAGGCCERCGSGRGPFDRHHRKRRRDGGDTYANILYVCSGPGGCHGWIHEHPAESRKAGWIVAVARDPASMPVWWRRQTWLFFDADGGTHPMT